MTADELRRAFLGFFVDRGHRHVASSGLIPHHPAAPLLTNAGMNQFIPVILGEEPRPDPPRATSVQKCFRTADIEIIGDTTRHLTFFEMLGNFSFGDYFKDDAIPWAWELVTEVLGMDPDRLWVTVYLDDDEAERIWREKVGVPAERVQRLGDDNFWEMAKGLPGPCGPCSEIYYDKGDEHGPAGGPAQGGPERYVEIWNLVFMQLNRTPGGELVPLPSRNIDTGAGLERILPILQGVGSVFEADVLAPLVSAASEVVGRPYGQDAKVDRALRIMADHGRAVTFLVSDGVFPSNEDRGYVLRRMIRRAVRHAFALGVEDLVGPRLVEAAVATLGGAWPEITRSAEFVSGVVAHEEERFRHTLRAGSALLDEELSRSGARLDGEVAFRLHDTFGFPLELTLEIAGERGVEVDVAGFETAMHRQRNQARQARRSAETDKDPGARQDEWRRLVAELGPTRFIGYDHTEAEVTILAFTADGELGEVFLDRSPFYAEAGGQVGDTGTITTETGTLEVLDTTYALPGLHRHSVRLVSGEVRAGQLGYARVEISRRASVRRNHTGTHLLHWALRELLGPHVKQAGSLVAPDRLRFDFSHYAGLDPEVMDRLERLVNEQVLENPPVHTYEMTLAEAERAGAIAFFGDKYGDRVRVVEAGPRSLELCGGTHVDALGTVGPVKIVSEGSIGSNLRRIEAVTGEASLERMASDRALLGSTATLLRVAPAEVPDRVGRLLDENRSLAEQVKALRRRGAGGQARELAEAAVDGVIVARYDGTTREYLRELAVAVRDQPGVRAVVLGGLPEGGGVALVAAVGKGAGLDASAILAGPARTVGGGGGRNPEVAVAGGRDASRLDEALEQARQAVAAPR